MNISGTFTAMQREKHLPPNDGVHIPSKKDGYLKGSQGVLCDGTLVPYGENGFYLKTDDDRGIKVFYGLNKDFCHKEKYVAKVFKMHRKLYKKDIAIKPYEITPVKLDIVYNGKKIEKTAYGIVVKHAHYPVHAWKNYCLGQPYDWASVIHENHNPDGFLRFQQSARMVQKEINPSADESLKLGDILWCIKKHRWIQVDISI